MSVDLIASRCDTWRLSWRSMKSRNSNSLSILGSSRTGWEEAVLWTQRIHNIFKTYSFKLFKPYSVPLRALSFHKNTAGLAKPIIYSC